MFPLPTLYSLAVNPRLLNHYFVVRCETHLISNVNLPKICQGQDYWPFDSVSHMHYALCIMHYALCIPYALL